MAIHGYQAFHPDHMAIFLSVCCFWGFRVFLKNPKILLYRINAWIAWEPLAMQSRPFFGQSETFQKNAYSQKQQTAEGCLFSVSAFSFLFFFSFLSTPLLSATHTLIIRASHFFRLTYTQNTLTLKPMRF